METDYKFLIGLEPKQIIEWFEKKGYKISWNWDDVYKEAHTKAFTVAKATQLSILSEIRTQVEKALKEGITLEEFKRNLTGNLRMKGWWGKVKAKDVPNVDIDKLEDPEKEVTLGSPYRLKNIYTTNLNVAYSRGNYQGMIANAVNRPYWMYEAVMDKNTRPNHAKLNGKVFRFDDPIWEKHYPPNGWGCRCSVRALDDDDLNEMSLKVSSGTDFDNVIKIDRGWDYNPGKDFFDFNDDFGKFRVNPKQKDYTSYGRPSLKNVDEKYFQEAPEQLPKIKDVGIEKFTQLVKNEFGLNRGDYSVIDTIDKDKAIIYLNNLQHAWEKQDGREQFLSYIKPTLQNPFEVFLTEYISDKGYIEYRKNYVSLFKDSKNRSFFTVLRLGKDGSIFWNAYPQDFKYMDKIRKGTLLFKMEIGE